MTELSLNGVWRMIGGEFDCEGTIPGSVYSFLLDNKLMEDPYYRQNELEAQKLLDQEFSFVRSFDFKSCGEKVILRCEGLDTLCDIYINDTYVSSANNMHRTYEYDVTDYLRNGENDIRIVFYPVDEYIKEKQQEEPLMGPWHCTRGVGHIRKASCMLGWDWGPRLPDAGIWRNISLLVMDSARITDFHVLQNHTDGKVTIVPKVVTDRPAEVNVSVITPEGNTYTIDVNQESEIKEAKLWWPNGLGEQPLYTIVAEVIEDGIVVEHQEKKIGLRTLKLIREKDQYGESFCHEVNGIRFFAMGADYIPEDNIFSRITPERTRRLLQQCKKSHFNTIRVWGGGYYPDDFFFDICDELGLVVFLDCMVACISLSSAEEAKENFRAEIYDNLMRIRHHAALAIISGNNEVEEHFAYYQTKKNTPEARANYLDIFERMIPEVLNEVCPYIPYIASSPTSCGHFMDPRNENYGDCHYWEVWHGGEPFIEYRKRFFRYLSEFGFQSFPCEKTVKSFTIEEDRNIFSRIMEMHQRDKGANGKILQYLSANYKYPNDFGMLLYTSQLLQADAIKCGVEHLRRHRGRCMGTLYWQLNDIWPTASWSSIDYYGRYKALQYVAKRFYNPILISCMETGEKTTRPTVTMEPKTHDYATKAQLCITNDTLKDVVGVVRWALRDCDANILKQGESEVSVPSLSVLWLEEMDFHKTDVDGTYFSYEFQVEGVVVSDGTALFTAPKHFQFKNPELKYEIHGDEITIYANAYAKYVEIDSPDSDFVLSDNFFDMNAGQKTVKILEGVPQSIRLRSVYDIR